MKKLITFLALISLTIFFIFSCQKDKPATYPGGNSSYTSIRTTVTGMVLDESNAPLTGVTVTAYGQTTTTNQYGTFVLKNINANKDRCVLQFTKAGFFKRAHGFIASANTVNYVRIVLLSNAATQNFSASAGGTVSLTDGSSVLFPPNSIVTTNGSAYTGTVNLIVKHLSPDAVNFGFTIPGGDLLGKDLNNKDVSLYTYGMLGVELTGSSGEALQLAAGTSATLTMSIAASQLSTAPASIPLWYFDETTSLWKEEGTANKVGNNYVGTVAHFSWWNCDYSGPKAYYKGKVVDCNGIGLPNVWILLDNDFDCTTDQNGEYQSWIPSGINSLQIQATAFLSVIVYNSQVENIPSLSTNQIFVVPDLELPCPAYIKGTLKTCTGENTDGMAFISNSSFYNFQYTLNGTFNLIAVENASLSLNASNISSYASSSQIVNSPFAPGTLNVGNILLCDTVSAASNNLTINGGPFSNYTLNIVPTNATGVINQALSVGVSGTAFPNYMLSFSLQTDSIIGSYPWGFSSLSVYIDSATANYSISSWDTSATSGITNISEVGNIGGRIKGNFSGTAPLIGIGQQWNVSLSGNFDVIRTQ